jgi:membrane-bound serine protease (ClpP class)
LFHVLGAQTMKLFHVIGAVALVVLAANASSVGVPPTGTGPVLVATIDGVINPMTAYYLDRVLEQAQQRDAQCVVVELNTPGGLDRAMRQMVQSILGSAVPVVVYVAPPGARAASAGLFITMAAHVAAMAPGTNIGAAHPVALGQGQPDSVMAEKVTNDAMATIRAIAALRNRNLRWAQEAVRRSVSLADREALDSGVVDLVAPSLGELLAALDGRQVTVQTTVRALSTRNAPIERVPMTWLERFLHIITDPDIALLLLSLGFAGIIIEFYTPGSFGPGIAGAILLILGFTALGSLPINWAGLILIALAAVLLVIELYTQSIGVLAVGAAIAFVLGALLLFSPATPVSPSLPAVSPSWWLIALIAAMVLGIGLAIARVAIKTHRTRPRSGTEMLIGAVGIAKTDLAPIGTVHVGSEEWSAENIGSEPIRQGDRVVVVRIQSTLLQVQRAAVDTEPQPTAQQ